MDKQLVSSIGRGLLICAAVGPNDTQKDAESLAARVLKLKMWPDDNGGTVRGFRIEDMWVPRILTVKSSGKRTSKKYTERCYVVRCQCPIQCG